MTILSDAVRTGKVLNRIPVIVVGDMPRRVLFTEKSQQEVEHILSPK